MQKFQWHALFSKIGLARDPEPRARRAEKDFGPPIFGAKQNAHVEDIVFQAFTKIGRKSNFSVDLDPKRADIDYITSRTFNRTTKMNTSEAIKQGLHFTGHYESGFRPSENFKAKCKAIRAEHSCRAVLVKSASGTSIYADDIYLYSNILRERNMQLSSLLEEVQKAKGRIAEAEQKLRAAIENSRH